MGQKQSAEGDSSRDDSEDVELGQRGTKRRRNDDDDDEAEEKKGGKAGSKPEEKKYVQSPLSCILHITVSHCALRPASHGFLPAFPYSALPFPSRHLQSRAWALELRGSSSGYVRPRAQERAARGHRL